MGQTLEGLGQLIPVPRIKKLTIGKTRRNLSGWSEYWAAPRRIAFNLALLALGGFICAVAVKGVLVPLNFLSGGITGICLSLHFLWPGLSIDLLYPLLNLPLFIVGWRYVGRRFFVYSLIGTGFFTAAVSLVDFTLPVHGMLPGALVAGIIQGIGGGLILRSQGSGGGVDIMAVMVNKRFSVRLGTTYLVVDSLVIACAAMLFSLEMAVYSMVFMFVNAKMVNLVVTGLSRRVTLTIISNQHEQITAELLKRSHGTTIINATGAYSLNQARILYTVLPFRRLGAVKSRITAIDPEAFVVVNETMEVIGQGVGNQPHW